MSDPDKASAAASSVPNPSEKPPSISEKRPQSQDDATTEGPESQAEPGKPFEPLYTLLTNTTTNATIHPRVHYIFSDDDPSTLSTATENPDQRALIVDLARTDADEWAISWVSSLSGDFAVTSSQLAVQHNEVDDTMMLRLEGVEREPVELKSDSLPSSGSGAVAKEDVDGLVDDFKRRMGVLRSVVDEGEKLWSSTDQPVGEAETEEEAQG